MALSGDDLVGRWPAVAPFAVVGSLCIVGGGIVAAVARPTHFGTGPWLAAYLVLVGGVAQIALGAGQAWLAAAVPDRTTVVREAVAWNVGAALVIVGTLVGSAVVTTIGGVVSVVALALFLLGVRRLGRVPTWASLLYRGLATFVLLSIPVGLVLSWIRNS